METELDSAFRKRKPFYQSKRFWMNTLLAALGLASDLSGAGVINGPTGLIVGAASNLLLNQFSDGAKLTIRRN